MMSNSPALGSNEALKRVLPHQTTVSAQLTVPSIDRQLTDATACESER